MNTFALEQIMELAYYYNMSNEKTTRRFLLFNEWQFGQTESWLTAMAGWGWRLDKTGFYLARFIKSEPAVVRYRCVATKPGTLGFYDSNTAYESAGWRLACVRQNTAIYCTDNQEAPEPRMDAIILADSLKPKAKDIVGGVTILALALFFICYIWLIDPSPSSMLKTNSYPFVFIVDMYIGIRFLYGEVLKAAMRRRLKRGLKPAHGMPYRLVRALNGVICASLYILLLAGMIVPITTLVSNYSYPPIPPGSLPVLRMTDLIGNVKCKPSEDMYEDADEQSEWNHYKTSWSLFVPQQLELEEEVTVLDVTCPVGSEYSPNLEADRYMALTPGIAAHLANLLVKNSFAAEVAEGVEKPPQRVFDESGFDSPDGYDHEIIAQNGSYVYYVSFIGNRDTKEIIPLLRSKAEGN